MSATVVDVPRPQDEDYAYPGTPEPPSTPDSRYAEACAAAQEADWRDEGYGQDDRGD